MARELENWLETYKTYTSDTESPEVFNTWSGISAIAGAIQRRVHFDHGHFNVYPNHYIVLVSPAGRCKKSTAIRIAINTLLKVPDINFTADSITREKLAADMAMAYRDEHSSVTSAISELGSLFSSSGIEMVVFLTDIYDCPGSWSHKTKSGGTTKIISPYLNLVAATTPSWLATAMPLDTIGIGFTSRVVFVYSDEPRSQEPIQRHTDEQRKQLASLINDLIHISLLKGEMKMTPEAYAFYAEWYRARVNQSRDNDTRLAGYFERKPIHVIKTSMVCSLAESDAMVIELEHIDKALRLLGRVEPGLRSAFKAVGRNPLSLDLEEICTTINKMPEGIPFAKILDLYRHSVSNLQLSEVMATLVTTQQIKVATTPSGLIYFPMITPDAAIRSLMNAEGQPTHEQALSEQIGIRGNVGITMSELINMNIGKMTFDNILVVLKALKKTDSIRVEPNSSGDKALDRVFKK